MLWIGRALCEKIRHDIVARTFALIAPVWRVLHQVSCCSKKVPNATKRKESHQNMSLGSKGVDQEYSLTKILTRHRGTNFCINCTNLARFEASFVQLRNGSKCTQMKKNAPRHEFWVQLCGSGAFIKNNSDKTFWHKLLH